MSKRSSQTTDALVKRVRVEDENMQQLTVASSGKDGDKNALIQTIKRTSGLSAPIMCLKGHGKEILDIKFSPSGDSLASAAADRTILLWRVYGDCANYGILRLPKGSATSLAFHSETTLVAGSTDHTVFLYDLKSGTVIRRFRGHRGIVNAVDVQKGASGNKLIASASDDGTVRIWSEEVKEEVDLIELGYPITSVKWSPDGQTLYIGGLDNDIHIFSLSTHAISYSLRGHTDTITSLCLSPNSSSLLTTSMDSVLHLWNVQPFAPQLNQTNPTAHPRLLRSFYGAPAGFEGLLRKASWSRHEMSDGGGFVAVGGADRALTVWDASTGEIRYKLPGHTGTVVCCDWSPKEPIIASGGVEGVIYLGEVETR
ncbi:WD repeat protein, Prp8 binding protein [Pseudohyphozyma bogoriensis]|nr:WD repeat protein, Prp8 binding protein [Pseudohyphozyma bogoriensis]